MTDPTEVAAFLRAIIERPDDDVPRLVFADYLDERGESERAEFIRVQCELARLMLTCPCRGYYCTSLTCDWTSDYGSLRRREQELLTRYNRYVRFFDSPPVPEGETWVAYTWVAHPDFIYSRGFVSEIKCVWSDWRRHAAAIRAATPLRVVRLTTWPGDSLYEPFNAEWPGIQFELPRDNPPIRSRPATTSHAVAPR